MPVHLLHRAVVDQRADRDAVLQAVARLEPGDPVAEHVEEGFGQGTVHEDPVGADAGLAGVEELDQRGAPGGVRRVGVGKHDERRVPAELERHPLDVPGRTPGEPLADLGRAGEGELAHGRVGQELLPHQGGPVGRDQVYDPRGHPHLVQDPEHLHRAQRRLLGRLEHDRAPGRERGPDLPGEHRDRVVPRGDRPDHAHRLAHHHEPLVGAGGGDRLPVDPLGLFGEPDQEVGRVLHLDPGRPQRLALLGGHQPGQVVGALRHQPVRVVQEPGPLVRGPARPGGERRLGGGHGVPNVLGLRRADLREDLGCRRVGHGEREPGCRRLPLTVDVQRPRAGIGPRIIIGQCHAGLRTELIIW